ncbi:MAG: 4-alpha-glucanotransferase, partial [Verrucomicrobiota bacterium]
AANRCDGRYPGFRPRDDDHFDNQQANCADGEKYLRMIQEAAGDAKVIAEDLGLVPDYVRPNLEKLGIAGMKVPQWEFHGDKVASASSYPELSFAAYTTHDHAPLQAQWDEAKKHMESSEPNSDEWRDGRHLINTFIDFTEMSLTQLDEFPQYDVNVQDALLFRLCQSNSDYVAIMITDLLGQGERVNVPGVMDGTNWSYRVPHTVEQLREHPNLDWMRDMTRNIISETGRG